MCINMKMCIPWCKVLHFLFVQILQNKCEMHWWANGIFHIFSILDINKMITLYPHLHIKIVSKNGDKEAEGQ